MLGIFILPAIRTFATSHEYTVLAPLPGTTSCADNNLGANCKTTLEKYLPGIFKLAIGLSAVAAVLMIVIGGLQYMSTDAIMKKEDGKKRIQNAIYGLVLVIGAWLILNTVNPNLLKLNLKIDDITTTAPAGGTLSSTGLQQVTQNVLGDLSSQCAGCTVTLTSTTGGAHDPNSAHYQGLAVDIAPNTPLTQYLTGSTSNPAPCRRVSRTLGDKTTTFLWEPTGSTCDGSVASTGDHWHMSVTP